MARWHTFHVSKRADTGAYLTRDLERNAVVGIYERTAIIGQNPRLVSIQFNAEHFTPTEAISWCTERGIIPIAGTVPTAKGEDRPIHFVRHDWGIFRFDSRQIAEQVDRVLRLLGYESNLDPDNAWIASSASDDLIRTIAGAIREAA